MKKSKIALFSFLLSASAATAQTTNPAPYCAAGYDDGFAPVPHYIKNVTLGTLNNTTGTTAFAAPHYAYYNSVAAPNLAKGSTYNLSVTHDGGQTIHWVAVYIDFNRNNSFDDAGERVLQQKIGAVSNPSLASVSIPATAATGTTRMRVMVFEDDMFTIGENAANARPCTADNGGSFDWGETEDYNVNITTGSTPINELPAQQNSTLIYPNPAKNMLYLDETIQDAAIKIVDLNGRTILDRKAISKSIDISSIKAGTYFLTIINGRNVFTQMIVIEK